MIRFATVLVLLAAASAAGTEPGVPVRRELAAGKARTVTVEVKLGTGDISVSTGAAGLLEVDCHGPDSVFIPLLEYSEKVLETDTAGVDIYLGHARVIQSQSGDTEARQHRWDIRLNPELCRELKLTLGVGNVTVDLAGTGVEKTFVEVGVGDITLDLTGELEPGVEAECETAIGSILARVPVGAGVVVAAECELGRTKVPERFLEHEYGWVSPEWDETEPGIRLELGAAIGDISVVEMESE